jgi:hypothetical protein
LSAQRQLLHDSKDIGTFQPVIPGVCEFLTETVQWRASASRYGRRMHTHKLGREILRHASDECFLGREMVVERCDVHTHTVGNGPSPKPFEALLGDDLIGRGDAI